MTKLPGAILAGASRPEGRGAGTRPSYRFHAHVTVANFDASICFYSQLFAAEPTVRKPDYAKWMLEDPRVNFAISERGAKPGIERLGIQAENRFGLEEMYGRLQRAGGPVLEEGATTCCYAQSEKSWIADPQGVRWEALLTCGESAVYGHARPDTASTTASAATGGTSSCCAPTCCKRGAT